ncbi:MAG: hypothetical protein ACPGVA_03295 [Pikeienuella sp.]
MPNNTPDYGLTATELFRFAAMCLDRLAAQGIQVSQSPGDQGILHQADKLGKPYFTKQLNPNFNDFTHANSFWLTATHQASPGDEPTVIGMAGARADRLTKGEFIPAFEQQMRRLYGPDRDSVLASALYPPPFHEMQGTVAYLGDLYFSKGFRGRDNINIRAFVLFLYAIAATEWSFDWLYLFVNERHASDGHLSKYLLAGAHSAPILWDNGPKERNDTDCLGTLRKVDFAYIVRRSLDRPDIF